MSKGSNAAVGMMDSAYFVGRKELLDFFNDLLDLNLNKIEETATGAVACQIADLLFPGSIPMSRVDWGARSDYEYVQNYKLLQIAFTKHQVQRYVDVDKLIRAKYQDNLEFCQWLKAFYEQSGGSKRGEYDACAVREKGKRGAQYNAKMGKSSSKAKSSTRATTNTRSRVGGGPTKKTPETRPLRERASGSNPVVRPVADNSEQNARIAELESSNVELETKTEELALRIEEMDEATLETEKERDFYFGKLRHIEILLQVHQEKGEEGNPEDLVEKVFKILYATADERLIVDDAGEVVESEELEEILGD